MLFEVEKNLIKTHSNLNPTGTRAVTDTDIIVPDYQPDVGKVIQAEVLPMVCEKEVRNNYIMLKGNMDYTILYISDEKDAPPRLKSISTRTPFTHQIEAAGAEDGDCLQVVPDVIKVEFNAVNSRKINIKSVVEFETSLMKHSDFEAVCGINSENPLPCRTKDVDCFSLCAFAENEFEINETLPISSGSEMIDEILKVDVKVCGSEIKSINGKLVAKGDVQIKALYCDTSGQLRTLGGEIPFTEVLDVDDVGENDICRVSYCISDLKYSAIADDDGDISLMEVAAQVTIYTAVYSQSTHNITDDLYSPDFDVKIERKKKKLCRMATRSADRSAFKEILDLPQKAPDMDCIYDVIAKPYAESAKVSGGGAQISGTCDIYIVYTSKDSSMPVHTFKKEIPFNLNVTTDANENALINTECIAKGLTCNILSPRAAEVRFALEFDTTILEEDEMTYIDNVLADEEKDSAEINRPGITIYFANKGERMWDIYKRYRTTAEDIEAVNKTAYPDILTEPARIMIPKRKIQ